ncbi:MAG: hypothetical protein C0616_10070 [Desulfuromonas sp.]|nr:MAG: hypothetical protein C0616_10070 [Desulfuromonas sp.]
MLGAIIGDYVGSRFEFSPHKSVDFPLVTEQSHWTDDTVHTVALAEHLLTGAPYAALLKRYFRDFPDAGYGGRFTVWAASDDLTPYNSFGNGSAMRVSPVGWFFADLETVLLEAEKSAAVTHDHPEGIRGAQAVAGAVWMARQGADKMEIRTFIADRFGYDLDRPLEAIRPGYRFDVTCQGSVPEAIICFLEATSYENSIRNAVSLGGDADTQACIAGSIAEAYYRNIPSVLLKTVRGSLPGPFLDVINAFHRIKMSGENGFPNDEKGFESTERIW